MQRAADPTRSLFPLTRDQLPLGAAARVQAAYQALEDLWDVLPPGELAADVSRVQAQLLDLQDSLGGGADLDVYGVATRAFSPYPDDDEVAQDRIGALRRGRARG